MNREIVIPGGAGIYPLQGDVQSQAGSSRVQVVGIQGTPVLDTFFNGGEVLEYNPNTNQWTPVVQPGIQVNSFNSTGDYILSVNVPTPITVNGV